MRTSLICVIAIISGCASTAVHRRVYDGPCLVAFNGAYNRRVLPADDNRVYRGGVRVPDDDVVAATADVGAASELAWRAERHQRAGLGAFLAGGVLLAPGLGLTGYGVDQSQPSSLAVGAALTAVGVAGVATGLAFL